MDLTDRLSKSKYTTGLRCPLALYLYVHHYDLKGPITPEQEAIFAVGNRVGEIARLRYPGGVMIDEDHFHHREAVDATRAALDAGASAIYEAAFTHDNVKVRVDVLRRLDDGGFELIEAKSTGSYKPEVHLADAGVQLHVLLGAGIDVRRVTLMHLDRSYVYPGGEYDPQAILTGTDITAEAFEYLAEVGPNLEAMMTVLALPEAPLVTPGTICEKPYRCDFFDWCNRDAEEPDYSGEVTTEAAVLKRLDDLAFPLYFVDFETVNPGLPVFVGTSPFQTVKVQWSVHALHEDGRLEHAEYLVDDASADPNLTFATALLDALGDHGTFVHYSSYERTQLVDIAVRNPGFRQQLVDRIPGFYDQLAKKLAEAGESYADLKAGSGGLGDFDLGLRVVRKGCLHPAFGPREYSIKTAVKLLARDLPPYEGLAVSTGDQAMNATYEMLSPDTPPERAAQIRRDLLEYCKQDTLAMVRIYQELVRRRE